MAILQHNYLPEQYKTTSQLSINHNYLPQQFSDSETIFDEIHELVKRGDFTLGQAVDDLEKEFEKITQTLIEKPLIQSDMHPYYKPIINHFFPKAKSHQLKGSQVTVMGQGELKRHRKDPLFSINHTLAMLR